MRKRFTFAGAAGAIAIVAMLAFGGIASATLPAGQQGAIGGDFDNPASIPDFGVDQQLQRPANNVLTDSKVFVVSGQCRTDTALTVACTDVGTTSAEGSNPGCNSTYANGQLPSNPKAPPGFVCVYVLVGQNAPNIHGVSNAPGNRGSRLGFKIVWDATATGDTYIDAVWAYQPK